MPSNPPHAVDTPCSQNGGVVCCFAGDGAYANGIVLESLNWAAMVQFTNHLAKDRKFGVPVIFLVLNNHYGMTGRADNEVMGVSAMARQPAYTLSGGERRRLEICRALAAEPSFIVLDEPFAGIDPLAVLDIQKIIAHLRDRGIGILITDHNVRETLSITDRAYILRDGSVFRSGTPRELASDPEVRRVYLGDGFRLDPQGT